MSFVDALPNGFSNTRQFSTPHTHSLPAYSQDEKFAVVPVDDLYVDLDIPSANARTITTDKFVIDLVVKWDGHAIIVNRLWENCDERDPPVNGEAGRKDEGSREGSDGKGKDSNEKKDVNRLNPRGWKVIRYVAELEKKFNETCICDSASLSDPTLDLKWPTGTVDTKVRDCPPKVYLAEDMDDLLKMSSFRQRTPFFGEMFNPVNRICRAIVMERLAPLGYVKCVNHFKQAIREVVLAHHLVFSSELRALHCDISIYNLMVRYCDTSTLYGVLIDFDISMMFGEITEDDMRMRTRSRLFMAWELLESDPPPVHLERFDWESFFYVICWVGCRYSEGKEVNKSALSHWYESDSVILACMKRAWLSGPEIRESFTLFYDTVFWVWIRHLQTMFYSGRVARYEFGGVGNAQVGDCILKEEFDEITLGGHVTWDRFWEILQN